MTVVDPTNSTPTSKAASAGGRDTHFPTETPKFIMGGVGPNFSAIANGPVARLGG